MYMYPIPNFFSCQVGVKIFGVQNGRKEIFPGGKFLWIEQMCDIMLPYKKRGGGEGMGLHDGHRKRMKERFLRDGLDGFADHEALELLLYYAIPRRDTNELAHCLLERFGSLHGVLTAPVEELRKIEGVGEQAATYLATLCAVGRRVCLQDAREEKIITLEDAGAYFMRRLMDERRETLYQVNLDAKGKVRNCRRLSSGTAAMTPVCIREVVENALHNDASRVLLGHNHPSGVALPSEEDRLVTVQIAQALKAMDITLMDHIVVADGDFVSMAASGMLL